MEKRMVIFVRGGVVEDVATEDQAKVLIVDQDGAGEADFVELKDEKGNLFRAAAGKMMSIADADLVDVYWKQVPDVREDAILVIPDYDPANPKPYPGDIKPGEYTRDDLVELLREQRGRPEAIQFISDMLEE